MSEAERSFPDEPNIGWTEALGAEAADTNTPSFGPEVVRTRDEEGGWVEWHVSGCENRIKAQYELWVRRNAEKVIQETENENPDEARKMRQSYMEARSAGRYNWDGSAIRESLSDVHGLRYLFFLLLKRCHPDMHLDLACRIYREAGNQQVGTALGWALANPTGSGFTNQKPPPPQTAPVRRMGHTHPIKSPTKQVNMEMMTGIEPTLDAP